MSLKYRRDLYTLFPDVTDCVAVEVGVAEANHSRDMCENGYKLVISVDAWECIGGQIGDGGFDQDWHDQNYKNACDLLRPYGGRSKILRGRTTAMAQYVPDESVDLVYIDADHSYQGCTNDIEAWWPKLRRGGVMAFHDFENPNYGVKEAVMAFAKNNGLQVHLIPEDHIDNAGSYFYKP